jgi:hypothetical protein
MDRTVRRTRHMEGGALRGALLPVTVFLAVKVTGGAGLARCDRALVGVWLCRRAAKPPGIPTTESRTSAGLPLAW